MQYTGMQSMLILVNQFLKAKLRESSARRDRIAKEHNLAVMLPGPEDGQVTLTIPDGRKVVVKRKLNYKSDCNKLGIALEEIRDRTGEDIPYPIKSSTRFEFDKKEYEILRRDFPEVANEISDLVTVTNAKTAVVITEPKK